MSKLRIFKFRKFKSDVPRVMVGGWVAGGWGVFFLRFTSFFDILTSNMWWFQMCSLYFSTGFIWSLSSFFMLGVGKNIQLVINLQLFLSILTKKSFLLFERESYSWWIRRPIHQERLKRFMIEDLQPSTIIINAVTIYLSC